MKNIKFIILILVLVAVSVGILASSMYLVRDTREEPKDYLFSEQSFDFNENHISEEAPTPQETLAERFQSMYEIDEEKNTITVISKKYLDEYWNSNYEKEEIKSLSVDEILFIIQDSIRIYEKYEKIILLGYESKVKYGAVSISTEFDRRYPKSDDYIWDGDETEKFWRVPYLQTQTIKAVDGDRVEGISSPEKVKQTLDGIKADIQQIIFYRIEALSSPKVFIQKAEFLRLVGENLREFSSEIPEQLYYCAGMKDATQRDEVLDALIKDYGINHYRPIDCGEVDLLEMAGDYYSGRDVDSSSPVSIQVYNGIYKNEVFLTDSTDARIRKYLNETTPVDYLLTFKYHGRDCAETLTLIPKTKKVLFGRWFFFTRYVSGKYTEKDNSLFIEVIREGTLTVTLDENGSASRMYIDGSVEFLPDVTVTRKEQTTKW